jgi:hypothetical protein
MEITWREESMEEVLKVLSNSQSLLRSEDKLDSLELEPDERSLDHLIHSSSNLGDWTRRPSTASRRIYEAGQYGRRP